MTVIRLVFSTSAFSALMLEMSILFSRQGVLSILLGALLPLPNYVQTSSPPADDRQREAGLPYMRIYNAKEYGGDQQNWDIVQDRRGVMYFANQSCLLEYDGTSWRQIYTGDRLTVRSVDIDSSGHIWMGAALETGSFTPDAIGNLQYTSLLPHVPSHIRKAADYWRAAVIHKTIYMQTRNSLLQFDPNSNTLRTLSSDSGFDKFIMLGNTLYIRKHGVGLMRMEGDSLHLIPGGERFADIGVSALLPFTDSAQPDAASEEFTHRPSFITVTRAHAEQRANGKRHAFRRLGRDERQRRARGERRVFVHAHSRSGYAAAQARVDEVRPKLLTGYSK